MTTRHLSWRVLTHTQVWSLINSKGNYFQFEYIFKVLMEEDIEFVILLMSWASIQLLSLKLIFQTCLNQPLKIQINIENQTIQLSAIFHHLILTFHQAMNTSHQGISTPGVLNHQQITCEDYLCCNILLLSLTSLSWPLLWFFFIPLVPHKFFIALRFFFFNFYKF